jgi:prepilin-type N-terminal cleavage/methylation domain-containing protein
MKNQRGVTLIELMVALIVCAFVVGGIYRLFVAQTRAYTVQDQVVEIQQNIRSAMDTMVRDIRLTGFDSDDVNSKIVVNTPFVLGASAMTVNYEYDNTTRNTVTYSRDAATARLLRQLTTVKDDGTTVVGAQEVLLDNVDNLLFTYGVDGNLDGSMDDLNANGLIDDGDWVPAASVGLRKVVAVKVTLQARPAQVDPDVQNVAPRVLTTAVTFRNLCLH